MSSEIEDIEKEQKLNLFAPLELFFVICETVVLCSNAFFAALYKKDESEED